MKRLLLCLLLTSTLLASAVAAATVTFRASITADQEVPATSSPGWGVATLVLDPGTGAFHLVVNLKALREPLIGSHIHLAPTGENGGVIVNLGPESAYRRAAGKNLHARFTGTVPAAHLEAMLTSGTYVNFHTPNHPGGAIRGQLIAHPVELTAVLSGDQEVPPNASPATGVAAILYKPATKTISVRVEAENFANPISASHIHVGPAGVAGPVTLGLGGEADYVRNGDSIIGEFLNLTYPAPAVPLLTGGTYLNIHSPQYPGGEIRGQPVGE